jgi:uncharacterized protein YukE
MMNLYRQFEVKVDELESNKLWEGASHQAFVSKFDEWKVNYLKRLAQLTQLGLYLGDIAATGEDLTKKRNALTKPLFLLPH